MNDFRLCYTKECGEYQLETCITTAIVRNVKNLYLRLFNQVRLPRCIFTHKNLVDLGLHWGGDIPMSGTICLPALKKLHLFLVKYESDKSLEHLLSGCPVLEVLIVRRMEMDPLVCCYISSPTLNRLELHSNFDNDGSYTGTYRVKIDTPALRYLHLRDYISKDLSSGPLTSLNEAHVCIDNHALVEGDVLYSRSMIEFVGRLCNVKHLILSVGWMEVPNSAFSTLNVKFYNLTKLNLDGNWRFISVFLENADNLEFLIIRTVNNDLKCWMEPKQVPTCLLSHLRTVRIDQFGCIENEFKMVRYLLRNAKIMDGMFIYSNYHEIDLKEKFDALKRISLFKRGSEACELAFY
ncbi:hypothetical protein DH2020_008137 [Rehmannia glutinosa]|uniref:FBD domain-containing protein n=1 Tax=Rehmannia glutinosa TaxID=99300 RepID=A0ABR0U041_REHGL